MKSRIIKFCFLFVLVSLFSNCNNKFIRNAEARDDANEMKLANESNSKILNSVTAISETQPVYSPNIDADAADDPAIWYNSNNPESSLIFGSNKKYGIHSYNLSGDEVQFLPCGTINNIDIRKGVKYK